MQKYTCEKCWWKIEEPSTYPKNIFQWAIEAHKNNFCKNKKTRHEMIKVIYEKISDKTLSFGCKIKNLSFENKKTIWIVREVVTLWNFIKKYVSVYAIPEQCKNDWNEEYIYFENIEIIWHPVMIWRMDILIEKWPNYFDEWNEILDLWEKKDEPIENQSEDCITYIYSLIK